MGEYTSLYIADYDVLSTKSYVLPEIMTIFRENDKKIQERKVLERLKLQFPDKQEPPIEEWDGANEFETSYEYVNNVANIKQRLDVTGFSIRRVKKEFEQVREALCDELKDDSHYWNNKKQDKRGIYQQIRDEKQAELGILTSHSFQDWIDAYQQIYKKRLRVQWGTKQDLQETPLINYILGQKMDIGFGFPGYDIRSFIRVFLEVCPKEALVLQDLTDVAAVGYYDFDESVCETSITALSGNYPVNEKYIILTEGATDKFILENAMELLYPHLSEYYSFMDFGLSNASGGASSLVSTVKSFVGSGIKNRIIAVFDNDTAAYAAMRGLKKVVIPENIKIINYPNLEIAKNYPALGPSGLQHQDINGSAVSVELFLGYDVLTKDDGSLTPVHWKGYDSSLEKYQGEIQNKQNLREKFFKKVKRCQEDPVHIEKTDWDAMKLLLSLIFDAFA